MATRKRAESPGANVSKLRMDRKPNAARINDPSHPAGKRKEIDNVMKKARQSNATNDYWDKKLLEVEEKDPNRWRHTGYKKLYIHGKESSSESDRESEREREREKFRYNGGGGGPSSSNSRKSPVLSRKSRSRSRSPGRRYPQSPVMRKNSRPRSPDRMARKPRPRSPDAPRRRPSPPPVKHRLGTERMGRRPPSPPPKMTRSPSSVSSCSDDSCSVCSEEGHSRSRSRSLSNAYPRSYRMMPPPKGRHHSVKERERREHPSTSGRRPASPDSDRGPTNKRVKPRPVKEASPRRRHEKVHRPASPSPVAVKPRHQQPPEPKEPSKKTKERPPEKLRTRVKIEGEPKQRRRSPSSASDDSESSENSIPTITATTRLTLSERFGKMAQWSVDRSNMENMKITKNSAGGDLKVLIEEGIQESPPRKYRYSPAPQGHFPEELMTQAPIGLASWDDIRVRYKYYKDRGYLRDLDLNDYIKWEEWWYKYQAWLKQERYYEMWEQRTHMNRRRRLQKKPPIQQRLN